MGLDFSKACVAGAQGKGCPLAFLIIYDVIVIVWFSWKIIVLCSV